MMLITVLLSYDLVSWRRMLHSFSQLPLVVPVASSFLCMEVAPRSMPPPLVPCKLHGELVILMAPPNDWARWGPRAGTRACLGAMISGCSAGCTATPTLSGGFTSNDQGHLFSAAKVEEIGASGSMCCHLVWYGPWGGCSPRDVVGCIVHGAWCMCMVCRAVCGAWCVVQCVCGMWCGVACGEVCGAVCGTMCGLLQLLPQLAARGMNPWLHGVTVPPNTSYGGGVTCQVRMASICTIYANVLLTHGSLLWNGVLTLTSVRNGACIASLMVGCTA